MSRPATDRKRGERIELRATSEEKALIEQAAVVSNTTMTRFALDSLTDAAQRVLADRSEFVLDSESLAAWEALNERPSRDLPGLRALMARPSPFQAE